MRIRHRAASGALVVLLAMSLVLVCGGSARAATIEWTGTGQVGHARVLCLAWDGTDTLYAGSEDGHVYSRTGGGPWLDEGRPLSSAEIMCLAWDGTDTLYAGCSRERLFSKSVGGNWEDTGFGGGTPATLLWDGGMLYVGSFDGHVYAGTGDGTWHDWGAPTYYSPDEWHPRSLVWNGTDTLYAAADISVYSTIGDGIWTRVGDELDWPVECLAWNGTDTLYAGCYDGVFFAWSGAGPWESLGYAADVPTGMAWDGTDTLYAGFAGGNVFSYTGAGPWVDTGKVDSWITGLAWDGTDTLYAGSLSGRVHSRAGAGAWVDTGNLGVGTTTFALARDGAGTLYAGSGDGRVYSRAGGGAWTDTGGPVTTGVNSLVWDGAGTLYAGCSDGYQGGRVYSKTGAGPWTDIGDPTGIGGEIVRALAWDGAGTLYAGCSDGHVYARTGGGAWVDTGDTGGIDLWALAWDGSGTLYAGCDSGHVYSRTGGGAWADTGNLGGGGINSLAWAGPGILSAGCDNGHVYSRTGDGPWTDTGDLGGGRAISLVRAGRRLYAGCENGRVYAGTAGGFWRDAGNTGGGMVLALASDGKNLYAGCQKSVYFGRMPPAYTLSTGTRGSGTVSRNPDRPFYDPGDAVSLKADPAEGWRFLRWDGDLAGSDNPGKVTMNRSKRVTAVFERVPSSLSTWYLAEGTTAWGFNTYITIENPNTSMVTAKLTYMNTAGESGAGVDVTRTINLPARSQTTVDPRWDLGDTDFSTKVTCLEGKAIAVDRTMFWTGEGSSVPGYHSSVGTTTPSKTWYLPEGSSAWGLQTWVLVLNPNSRAADLTLTYMTEGGPVPVKKTVPAHSRATFSMASDIGAADASIEVTSSLPVVAERSVYTESRREGSCSIGATAPSSDYFLSEGAVGYDVGFTTWILVQNPQDTDNTVTLTCQTQSGEVAGPTLQMGPNTRKTINVNDYLPENTNVSTTVHGEKPLVAERAMYWDNGTGEAFHASIGLTSPHMNFLLPDGQTASGCQTWTLVANPNPGAVRVRITYLPEGGGEPVSFTGEIPPGTRATYNMAEKLGSDARASILVESLDGARPVMAERAMYFNDRSAGTDTIGGFSD